MSQTTISHYASSPFFQTTISNSPQSNDSFRLSLTNPSFVSESGNHLTESFKVNKDCLICSKITFVAENQWLEAAKCQICTIYFDKLKANFRHHCRICGNSVCGLCSNKKINEKRACDLCFLRIESQELIDRKERMLNLKDDNIKDLEITMKVTKDKLNKVFDEIQALKSRNLIEEKENIQKIKDQQKKLDEAKEVFLKVSESNNKSKEIMIKNLEVKKKKSEHFDKQLKVKKELAADNERQMCLKQHKVEELENLINQIAKTKTTKSYGDIYEFLEIDDDMINFQIENNSKCESLDELSSFVVKMRKSLAKSSKKSLMMKHSLLKGSMMDRKRIKSREKKLGLAQNGICCGNSDCNIF